MNMQSTLLKIFTLFSVFWVQITDIQGQQNLGLKADSLFNAKDYEKATNAYVDLVQNHKVNKANTYLKLAYMYEAKGDFLNAIYYLSALYEVKPSEELFGRIHKIALENSYLGFERSELNFLITLYKQYYIPIVLILLIVLIIGVYYVFTRKHFKSAHVIPLLVLMIFLLLVNNFANGFQQGIVKNNEVTLRAAPSAGSEVVKTLNEGFKVNILGKSDIWYKVLWNRKIYYINSDKLWLLGD